MPSNNQNSGQDDTQGSDDRGSNHTNDDRNRGGSNGGGNFKSDPERASEAGKKGGKN